MTQSLVARVDRGARMDAAMKEIEPIFDALIKQYMLDQREVARAEPWAGQKMANLAVAANIIDDIRATIKNIIKDGELAQQGLKSAQTIAKMSPEQRRYADAVGD